MIPTNDIVLPPTPTPSSTSGCEATDFPAAVGDNSVALIQRGTCTFSVKAANAEAAGYAAAIIFNEGQPGREDLSPGTLGGDIRTIPILALSFADGAKLYNESKAGPVVVHAFASTENDPNRTTVNVIADSPKGKIKGQTVVIGAHLDSVTEGPGINDNGSGTSTILEIAEQMAALKYTKKLQRQVRFAFWGAEENGTLGSEYYVDHLTDNQRAKIYANLNFDMVASPNYVRFVYDGDGSDTPGCRAARIRRHREHLHRLLRVPRLGVGTDRVRRSLRLRRFHPAGIPAGGLFSGAEGIKTPEEAATYGGTAGVAYDSCYHQACDTINNLNTQALYELGDAAAHATLTLAMSKTGLFPDGSRHQATATKQSTARHEKIASR